jgi:hypothetical protein
LAGTWNGETYVPAKGAAPAADARRQMRVGGDPMRPNVPRFGTPQDQRSHLTPAQQNNFRRLKTYFDPNSNAGFPLSRLGAMASEGNTVERWQTPVSLLGLTTMGDHSKEAAGDPLLAKIFGEAGYDPKTVGPGQIAVGPQFDKEENLILEHELMHRAIQAYFPDRLGATDEEVLLRTITATSEDKAWVNSEIEGGWDRASKLLAPKRAALEREAREKIKELRRGRLASGGAGTQVRSLKHSARPLLSPDLMSQSLQLGR